jgi:nucleotide-binding universal stress UspA family protein
MSTEIRERYDVVLLVEQSLSNADARQVRSLHQELDAEVVYHVLLPMADAAAAVEASLGAMGGVDMMATPMTPSPDDIEALREENQERAERELAATLTALEAAGATIGSSQVVVGPAVDTLIDTVKEQGGQEAIVLTRPHVVAEFFHVDWTSRARRKLGVPVLHLLEHENFDEQAGGGEGVSGA